MEAKATRKEKDKIIIIIIKKSPTTISLLVEGPFWNQLP